MFAARDPGLEQFLAQIAAMGMAQERLDARPGQGQREGACDVAIRGRLRGGGLHVVGNARQIGLIQRQHEIVLVGENVLGELPFRGLRVVPRFPQIARGLRPLAWRRCE